MNYSKMAPEIVQILRGKRSQQQMSHLLGYTFNQVHRWEIGKTKIKWHEFVKFCQISKAPLNKAIKESFSYFSDLEDQKKLLKHFLGSRSVASLCKELEFSPSAFSRLLNGKTEINFEQVLHIMEIGSIDFLRFIEMLCKGSLVPEIAKKMEVDRKLLKLYATFPWLSILLSGLDLVEYKKNPRDSFLAEKTNIPLKSIQEALKEMESLDLVRKEKSTWVAQTFKIAIRSEVEDRKKIGRYICDTAALSVEKAFGKPSCRHAGSNSV